MRGYFGIGIENGKTEENLGTLWRSAHLLGAAFIFTVGRRYNYQASDTPKAWKHLPMYHHQDFEGFYEAMPKDCRLMGIEIDHRSTPICRAVHPERCIYLLGAEDHGLSKRALEKCHGMLVLPGDYSMNVAVAGSIVMYDRMAKEAA